MRTTQNTEEDSNDTEPADERSIPMEYSSDQLYSTAKVKEQQQRIIFKNWGQYKYRLIIWNIW